MAGVKGKSGRKSWDKEVQSKELWNLSIPVLKHVLLSNDKSLKFKKIEIALALVNKMLPQEHDHSGEISGNETKIIIINNKDGSDKYAKDLSVRADRQAN